MAETNALNDMVSLKPYPNVSAFLSGTKQAPTPKGYVGVAEIAPAQQELRQAQAKAREDIGKADINIEKAKREEEAAKMQVDVDVEKESAERIKQMPERLAKKAKQEELNALKFMPTKDTAKDIAGLFSLIGIISMALGGGGRMSGHLALGNMNAMMEGYRKGRTDLNKREAVEFDKNFKAMQAALETLSREYKDALEIEKSDKERGRLERHMALAKANSPVLKAMEEKLGPVNTNQTIDDLLKDLSNAATMKNNLQKHADDVQARKDAKLGKSQIFTGSDGNTYAYDPFTKKVTPVELPQGVTLSKVGGAGGAKTPEKEKKQTAAEIAAGFGTGPSALVEQFIGDRLPTKQADPIINAAAAIGEADELKKTVKESPGIVGREGQIRQFVDRYIKSAMSGKSDLPQGEEFGTDPKAQEALRFAKRYASYLVNYERSLAPGSRGFTVYFQRRFNDLMSQDQFNAPGMIGLLDDQQKEVLTQATRISGKANMDNMKKLGHDIVARGVSETPSAPPPAVAPTAERGTDEKGSFHYEYNADRTKRRKVYD